MDSCLLCLPRSRLANASPFVIKRTFLFHERHRARHFPAQRNRQYEASQPGSARLGARNRNTDTTKKYLLVRRVRSRERIPDRGITEAERADQAEREKSFALILASLKSKRCRPCRAIHFHLHADQRGSGADEQLVRADGNVFEIARPAQRRDARAHDVRRALHHGAARFAACQNRLRNYRFKVCRAQHANHDTHGGSRVEAARRQPKSGMESRRAFNIRCRSCPAVHLPFSAG